MTTADQPTTSATVDRLLDAIVGGRGATTADLYAADAVLDATTPGWRFTKRGGAAVAEVWSHWFDAEGRFEELDRHPIPGGEVVRYLVASQDRGVPYAAHHCHIVTLDEATGLIARHQVWCGGRWDAARLAEMEEAARGR